MPAIKAMIISVGGTPQPIEETISAHKPEFISFYASQKTRNTVAEVEGKLKEMGVAFRGELTLIDNENDLLHCHIKATEAVDRVKRQGYQKDEIIVDYTGGTKNMSVALALAVITDGYSFSYVGGEVRTKSGVGTVVDGEEKIYRSVNPWDFLAIDERRKIATLFNNCQYKSAAELAGYVAEKNTRYRALYRKLRLVIDGYYLWDLMKHGEAIDRFKRARIDEIHPDDDRFLYKFMIKTERRIPYLQNLKDLNGKPSIAYITDLFQNGERRFKEGKIDDAILRLYRIVEMIAQERLLNRYSVNTSDVDQDKIPEALKNEYISKYRDTKDGKIRIPLEASYKFLLAMDDEIGKIYNHKELQFRSLQSARNYSYLAHGFTPAKESTYLKLRDYILSFNIVEDNELAIFPEIR